MNQTMVLIYLLFTTPEKETLFKSPNYVSIISIWISYLTRVNASVSIHENLPDMTYREHGVVLVSELKDKF